MRNSTEGWATRSGHRACWPLSAVTDPGLARQSTDAGCNEVTSLGPWPPGRDRATGQAGHRTVGQGHRACVGPLYSLLSWSRARLTEALTTAGSPSQKDCTLGGRLTRGPGIRANDHPWDIFLYPWILIDIPIHEKIYQGPLSPGISKLSLGCYGPWITLVYPMSKHLRFYQTQPAVQNAAGISENSA